jgi:hypothetical protein
MTIPEEYGTGIVDVERAIDVSAARNVRSFPQQ